MSLSFLKKNSLNIAVILITAMFFSCEDKLSDIQRMNLSSRELWV